jgi:glycolate oxidase FAD binding subunit
MPDFTPQSVHQPTNFAEVGALIRRAAAADLALYPFGGGTMQHLGYTPTKPGLGIDMRGFCEVIDYPARDMTITVQAGITIAKLQEVLAQENQRLPVDVPQPEIATLGGAIAVNASGPRRYGCGTLRDYVIGISFMNDAGEEVKAGGRVVKNVAGYDICKLQIGALGTLGIITQVTLKVKPKPEAAALLTMANLQAQELEARLEQVLRTQTRPAAIDVKTASGPIDIAHTDRFSLWVLFEDSAEAVRWQVEQLNREWGGTFLDAVVPGLLDNSLAQLTNNPAAFAAFRANMLPSRVAEFMRGAFEMARRPYLYSNVGNGIVYGQWTGLPGRDQVDEARRLFRQLTVPHQGNLIITRCPAEWKRKLPIWGEPRGDWALMKKVKHEIDPKNLFNPGRFIVG